ncbi:MAG: TAT-variant-translocated molybdopterin oxidoreductase [Microscillaceae bacterium]|nr:TAT-variant-translocated molybdopterin oxidoreductase [Microscillaceae bacterium]MDW8461720.1 TAT-variant-translocated molybdopterin oxidoreductase [Cytophagales bacterium]
MEEKKYWRGLEELTNDTEFVKNAHREFVNLPNTDESDFSEPSRRDFLKLMGFSIAAASLAACEAPVKKAIPYLNKPEDIDPGIPNIYATSYFQEGEYASLLVKTREGRPIKIEPNNDASFGATTSARVQASVLNLYDDSRYKTFVENNQPLEYPAFDEEKNAVYQKKVKAIDEKIIQKLASASNIRLVSGTIISPSTQEVIKEFIKKYPNTKHITYDTPSASGILKANKKTNGVEVIPTYNFDKAEIIVSFGADFLNNWLNASTYAKQYAQNRKLSKDNANAKLVRHYQFEARMSLTGANADYRAAVKPSEEALLVAALYDKLNGGNPEIKNPKAQQLLDKAATELQNNKGKSLVVSGSNDENVQIVVNAINKMLDNYGATIDLDTPLYIRKGKDEDMLNLIEEIKSSSVDAIIFYGVNPVFTHPKGDELKSILKNVALKISFAERPDETSVLCDFVCPDHNYLEAWNDAMPRKGFYALAQPTISPIFKTRAAQESLLIWAGNNTNFYDYIRSYWKANLFGTQTKYKTFEDFWNYSLHDGFFETTAVVKDTPKAENKKDRKDEPEAKTATANISEAKANIEQSYKVSNDVELVLYETTALATGLQANNPWLQELPDPVTKACWGNYVCVSQKFAKEKDLKQEDVIKVEANGKSVELPVLIQPGQANNTLAIAIGYGRTECGKVGKAVGANAIYLATTKEDSLHLFASQAKFTKTDKKERIAQTQTHHTIMGRDIIQEATLSDYQKDPAAGRSVVKIHTSEGLKKATDITLWRGHKYHNHSWGMVIDLNSCIGCGACVIACQVENNIPTVGKKEVLMAREMHWIRIDRYYSSDAEKEDLKGLEVASEDPQVTFQPMMCQHCNNAPCETVCPVVATTHSSEGLNQMAYNRCIGTRYCANNCPYKVRRFNWFHYAEDSRFATVNYTQTTDLGRMVLNPNVTVRSRGVMEKCSMCVQRIQEGKLTAKKEKRTVKDEDIITACAQTCPTEAIVFGDMNNTESKIAKILNIKSEIKRYDDGKEEIIYTMNEPRAYHVLAEINIKPQVSYLTRIRNIDKLDKKEKKA